MSFISQNSQLDRSKGTETEDMATEWRFPDWLLAIFLALVTIIVYWPAMGFGFINYDDGPYVTDNLHVQNGLTVAGIRWALGSSVTGNWHPLTMLSLMLDAQLFGRDPWGYHLTNLLLHAANTALIFLLLRRLTGAIWPSALVAALFGWHPLNVESVAWVAERKSVLCLFFGLLTLLFYVAYAQRRVGASRGMQEAGRSEPKSETLFRSSFLIPHSSFAYWLALVCFALGLLSKSLLVTWPFVMLLLDYWPLSRFRPGQAWPLLREKIPFLLLVAVVIVVTIVTHRQEGDMMALGTLSFAGRAQNALISYGRYLGKLFWPDKLAIFYPLPAHWPAIQVLLAAGLIASVSGFLWAQRRHHPFLLVGWLWYLGILVPVIGLVQVGAQAMADRHAYIPSLGIFIMVAWGALEFARRWRGAPWTLSMLFASVLILCLGLTRHQLGYWRNSERLFRHALAVTDDNFIAHYNLGCALADAGETDAAISQYREAIRLMPNVGDFYGNLGVALIAKGEYEAAIREFQEVLRFEPNNINAHNDLGLAYNMQGQTNAAIHEFREAIRWQPDNVPAHYDLGVTLDKSGQTEAAVGEFQEAITLDPGNTEARYNLANALAKQGQTDAAIREFAETIRRQPANANAHNNLGNLLAREGRTEEAISELQKAIRLKPADADTHYNLGNSYLRAGRNNEALGQFQEASRLKPDYAPSHYNLGVALKRSAQPDAAIREFQEAIRLQPDYAIAHNSLGTSLAAQGRLDEAISQFQEALRIKPDYASAKSNLANALALKNK